MSGLICEKDFALRLLSTTHFTNLNLQSFAHLSQNRYKKEQQSLMFIHFVCCFFKDFSPGEGTLPWRFHRLWQLCLLLCELWQCSGMWIPSRPEVTHLVGLGSKGTHQNHAANSDIRSYLSSITGGLTLHVCTAEPEFGFYQFQAFGSVPSNCQACCCIGQWGASDGGVLLVVMHGIHRKTKSNDTLLWDAPWSFEVFGGFILGLDILILHYIFCYILILF